ncbi:MAG: hypothetical protein GKR93_15040 [Gammaproteobacteria bacterium]|nr:hypothetical protein [Gammaproteobacteria bacterium]
MKEDNIDTMVRAFFGLDIEFEYDWVCLYTFQCRRMKNFVHDRVIFAGDPAHLVSPFGARGANGGLQEVDNQVWKLDLIDGQENWFLSQLGAHFIGLYFDDGNKDVLTELESIIRIYESIASLSERTLTIFTTRKVCLVNTTMLSQAPFILFDPINMSRLAGENLTCLKCKTLWRELSDTSLLNISPKFIILC